MEEGAEFLSGGQVLLGAAAAGELLAPSGKWEVIGKSEYPLLKDGVFWCHVSYTKIWCITETVAVI